MDVFDLLAKLTLDTSEYEGGLNNAQSSAEKGGSKIVAALGTVAKVGAAAMAAVGTAAVAMGKQALEAYADYEQLSGGIETLYGENTAATQKMMENASNAWKTAGMSANQYMETAIESSAAMISSLSGDVNKAAELMDLSIVDMSDNVNKMGTTMEAVQNAYRGFSRGNFTMLDNLALGFAGTKEGMQELLDKARELSGVTFDIDSYSDIVQAIHVVQESMGIAGTTAKEASETISGSINSMKAAWQNLLTGIADSNADLDKLMDDLVKSIVTVGKNIIPKIKTVIQNVSKLINVAAKELVPMIISVIVESLPDLVTAGVELIVALITGIAEALPQIIAAVPQIIEALVNAIIENLPALKEAGNKILEALVLGIVDLTWYLVTAIYDILNQLGEKISEWWQETKTKSLNYMSEMGTNLLDWLTESVETVSDKLEEAYKTISDNLKETGESLAEWYEKQKNSLGSLLRDVKESASNFYNEMMRRIKEFMQNLYDATIGKIVETIEDVKLKIQQFKDKVAVFISEARAWGRDLVLNFVDGIAEQFPLLTKAVTGIANFINKILGFSEPEIGPLSNFHTYAPDMMKLFAKGIKDNEHLITDQISSSFDFGDQFASPIGAGSVSTSNTYNITVNGIDELEEMLRWFESRQVRKRMA